MMERATALRRMSESAQSSSNAPSVRARFLQRWLQNVWREDEPWRTSFFALLPADVRAEIERALPDTWLPVDRHVRLADVLRDAFGPARAHDYYRRDFVRSLTRPPFASFVQTGVRLLGVTPAGLLRWSGRAYETVFRNAGTARAKVLGPGHAKVSYVGLPAVCAASDAWLDSAQASVYGGYDFLGTTGVVRIDKSRRAEGLLELELEWTVR